jgi:hypothetical protein
MNLTREDMLETRMRRGCRPDRMGATHDARQGCHERID